MEENHLKPLNALYEKSMKPSKNWQSISIETDPYKIINRGKTQNSVTQLAPDPILQASLQ